VNLQITSCELQKCTYNNKLRSVARHAFWLEKVIHGMDEVEQHWTICGRTECRHTTNWTSSKL